MTPATLPPQRVEVCEMTTQAKCPSVQLPGPMWGTWASGNSGEPQHLGRIVRLEPMPTGDLGAWLQDDDGMQWHVPLLRLLSLTVGIRP